MEELFQIQNDLLFTCKLITFIALMIAGLTIAIKLYQGQEVDERLFNWFKGIALVLGFSYMLGAFIN
jgi:hypothetical protein